MIPPWYVEAVPALLAGWCGPVVVLEPGGRLDGVGKVPERWREGVATGGTVLDLGTGVCAVGRAFLDLLRPECQDRTCRVGWSHVGPVRALESSRALVERPNPSQDDHWVTQRHVVIGELYAHTEEGSGELFGVTMWTIGTSWASEAPQLTAHALAIAWRSRNLEVERG